MSTPPLPSLSPGFIAGINHIGVNTSLCSQELSDLTKKLLKTDLNSINGPSRKQILEKIEKLEQLLNCLPFGPYSLVYCLFTPEGSGWSKSGKNLVKKLGCSIPKESFRIFSLFFEKIGFPPPQMDKNILVFSIPYTQFTPNLLRVAKFVEKSPSKSYFSRKLKRLEKQPEDELLPREKSTLLIIRMAKEVFQQFYFELSARKPALSAS